MSQVHIDEQQWGEGGGQNVCYWGQGLSLWWKKLFSKIPFFLHGLYLLCWYANLLVQIFEVKVPDILKINLYLINMKLLQPPNEN